MRIIPLLAVLILTGCTTQPCNEIAQAEKSEAQPEAAHALPPTQQKTPSDKGYLSELGEFIVLNNNNDKVAENELRYIEKLRQNTP
ncbi:hypothetical protein MNBD_GAMMA11-479 [hydrothermal vent metagenome]|uniref:Uncharacterized protein n=1 Tax=hydrothermal vent metagenome TaxID=652676 RepID=A0A3B0XAM8_9ZZZZ